MDYAEYFQQINTPNKKIKPSFDEQRNQRDSIINEEDNDSNTKISKKEQELEQVSRLNRQILGNDDYEINFETIKKYIDQDIKNWLKLYLTEKYGLLKAEEYLNDPNNQLIRKLALIAEPIINKKIKTLEITKKSQKSRKINQNQFNCLKKLLKEQQFMLYNEQNEFYDKQTLTIEGAINNLNKFTCQKLDSICSDIRSFHLSLENKQFERLESVHKQLTLQINQLKDLITTAQLNKDPLIKDSLKQIQERQLVDKLYSNLVTQSGYTGSIKDIKKKITQKKYYLSKKQQRLQQQIIQNETNVSNNELNKLRPNYELNESSLQQQQQNENEEIITNKQQKTNKQLQSIKEQQQSQSRITNHEIQKENKQEDLQLRKQIIEKKICKLEKKDLMKRLKLQQELEQLEFAKIRELENQQMNI